MWTKFIQKLGKAKNGLYPSIRAVWSGQYMFLNVILLLKIVMFPLTHTVQTVVFSSKINLYRSLTCLINMSGLNILSSQSSHNRINTINTASNQAKAIMVLPWRLQYHPFIVTMTEFMKPCIFLLFFNRIGQKQYMFCPYGPVWLRRRQTSNLMKTKCFSNHQSIINEGTSCDRFSLFCCKQVVT